MVPVLDRFLAKISKDSNTGCWNWTGAKHWNGNGYYGSFRLSNPRRQYLAHRAAWLLFKNEEPNEYCICHHCDNRLCVNPEHLFKGTQRDNMQDMIRKGRGNHAWGQFHACAKLTNKQAEEIRALHKEGHFKKHIAHMYGVDSKTVRMIIANKSYHHIVSGGPNLPSKS